MPKQRTGYVYYDEKRKTWMARLKYKDELGRTRSIRRQVGNKTEGNNLLKKLLNDIDQHSSLMVLSLLPEASVLPSGEKATE